MNSAELRRELDWRLQNLLTWSAPVVKRRLRDPGTLAHALAPAARERWRELAARYPLGEWTAVCTAREYQLNLYVLDLLDRHLPRPAPGGRGLDIGAGAWAYLPALRAWSGGAWDGVELDAHRRYWTLATRRAHAGYMCRPCPDCRYRAGSLLGIEERYPRITWFLPYVRPAALHAARLPARFFDPQRLLAHAFARLAPGGTMFVVNQGEDEAAAQQALFTAAGVRAAALGELASPLSPFARARYGWRVDAAGGG